MAVTVFEFGDFRLDCDRFELCRRGRSLKLERKPMELLILLAKSHGRLVTRAEIVERLWGSEVFVDTEHGINTAIRKIRQALDDDPEAPRFVQTVTGKGYRFVGAAHLAMGSAIFFKQWNWAQADQEVSRAIELNPGFAEAYYFRSNMLTALHRGEEAVEVVKKSMELDPFARPYALAAAYMDSRQYDAAVNEARIRLETYPRDAGLHDVLGDAYRRQGLWKEAVREWATSSELSGDKKSAEALRRHFQGGDSRAMVLWQLSDLKKKSATQYVSPVYLAMLHAELGQREETLSLLEEGYRRHSPQLLWIQCDPGFDFLHGDERYRAIIRKVGLPPAW